MTKRTAQRPHDTCASRDFARATLVALNAKGITILGLCSVPSPGPLGYANAERCYQLNDNGTGRVRPHSGVLELAGIAS